MIDMHCHILPGIDDGAKNADESLAMLRKAKSIGITHIVATPHLRRRKLDPERVAYALRTVRDMAGFMGIQVVQGYEVNLQAIDPENMQGMKRYCFEGTNTLLLEMPEDAWPSNWERILYRLQNVGIDIVIAHPERYQPLQRDFDRVLALIDMDCKLQLDAESLVGFWRDAEKRLARDLLEDDLVHFVASDAHTRVGYANLQKALQKIARLKPRNFELSEIERQITEQGALYGAGAAVPQSVSFPFKRSEVPHAGPAK